MPTLPLKDAAGAAPSAALHHTMTLAAQAGPFPTFGLFGLLTYDDAAKILKTTTRHVERLVSRRQLKAVALGQGDKLPRIRPADLLAFIDGLEPITRADDPA